MGWVPMPHCLPSPGVGRDRVKSIATVLRVQFDLLATATVMLPVSALSVVWLSSLPKAGAPILSTPLLRPGHRAVLERRSAGGRDGPDVCVRGG